MAVRNSESTRDLEVQFGDKVVTLQDDVFDTNSIKQVAEQTKDVEELINNAGVVVMINSHRSRPVSRFDNKK